MPIAMRLRIFLQLMAVLLCGALLTTLIVVAHLPRWLEEALSLVVATVTLATMWMLRAKRQTIDPSRDQDGD